MEKMNATAACILGLLNLGKAPWQEKDIHAPDAMTGWQLYEAAADSLSRFWHVTRSQVYRELSTLEKQGCVEAEQATGPRESRAYRITPAGKEAFKAWLEDWVSQEPRDEQLHSPLVLTVFFGEFLQKEKLKQVLQEYRGVHQRRLERLNRLQQAVGQNSSPAAATMRRGISYHELMIQWIDSILAEHTWHPS